MNKQDNLIGITSRTKEERVAIARSGGINSGKARAERANFRKILESILTKNTTYEGAQVTYAEALALSCIKKGVQNGDCNAMATIRDTIGQKPVDVANFELTTNTTHERLLTELSKRIDLENE